MGFNKNYEEIISRIIMAETSALNSEKGREIMQELLKKAKEQNPNITPEEWSKTKQNFMVMVFYEIIKENPQLMSNFIGLFQTEIKKDKIGEE